MIPVDTYRDAFRAFLAQGMTHSEALDQFETSEFMAAVLMQVENREGLELFNLYCLAHREKSNEYDMEKALELWLAGWTSETPHVTQIDVMSWYWRAPSKRRGRPGRRYLSTNQAYNAMKRHGKSHNGVVTKTGLNGASPSASIQEGGDQ